MTTTTSFIVDIDLRQNGGQIKIRDEQALDSFAKQQREYWSWMQPLSNNNSIFRIVNFVNEQLRRIDESIQNYKSGTWNTEALAGTFSNVFNPDRPQLFHHSSKSAKFLLRVTENTNATTALSAYAFLTPWTNQFQFVDKQSVEGMMGIVEAALFRLNVSPATPRAVSASFDELAGRYDAQVAEAELAAARLSDKVRDLIKLSDEKLKLAKRFFRMKSFRHYRDHMRRLSDSEQQLKQLEALYAEHMRLKSPVEYWRAKAINHETTSMSHRSLCEKAAMIFVGVLASVLILVLWAGPSVISRFGQVPYGLVLLGGTLISMASLGFWAIRVLVRLYLSEHHLAIDARERETMAQTYLALIRENASSEEDRAIVLAALFRPTADGIVKDDAAPDLSLPSLISRIAEKRSP